MNEIVLGNLLAFFSIFIDYLLIRLGQGSIWFMVLALASLILGSPMVINYFSSGVFLKIATVVTSLWALYKIFLYKRICDRYNANVIIIVAGFIMQFISKLVIPGIVLSAVGQAMLMVKVKNNVAPKTIIKSKIIVSKMRRKEKNK